MLVTICNYDYYQSPKNYERANESANESAKVEPMVSHTIPSNNKNYKNDKNKEGGTAKRFIPPTVLEVEFEILEKGYSLDAEAFIAFYESKNWMVGQNKMQSWKAALITWTKRKMNGAKKAHPITKLDSNKKYEKW